MKQSVVTTEQAMREFMETRGFIEPGVPSDQWYVDNWVRVQVGRFRVPVFPIYGFKKTLFLHDIHHLLAGYDTDFKGEVEIAAWELSSGGCGWYLLYWLDRFFFTALGLIFAPIRTCRAFKRGLAHKNIFDKDPREVLAIPVEELKRGTLEPDR